MKTNILKGFFWVGITLACLFILALALNLVHFNKKTTSTPAVAQCNFGDCEQVETLPCPYAEQMKADDPKCVAPTAEQMAPDSTFVAEPQPVAKRGK